MADEFDDWMEEREDGSPRRDEQTDRPRLNCASVSKRRIVCSTFSSFRFCMSGMYFHWITSRALRELIEEGTVNAVWEELSPGVRIRLVMRRSHRYWRREAQRVLELVRKFSTSDFGRAIGPYGELLVDAALGTAGMRLLARDVLELDGRMWTETDHNLDRAFELDGVRYGVEIKNTLKYIDDEELEIKLGICSVLGLRPLFVVRMMPKCWTWPRVIRQGGYVMMLGEQFYPLGAEAFADEVREQLSPSGLQAAVGRRSSGDSCGDLEQTPARVGGPEPGRCGFGRQFRKGLA